MKASTFLTILLVTCGLHSLAAADQCFDLGKLIEQKRVLGIVYNQHASVSGFANCIRWYALKSEPNPEAYCNSEAERLQNELRALDVHITEFLHTNSQELESSCPRLYFTSGGK